MGKIKKILENELVGGTQSTDVYPVTSTKAVYDEYNESLDDILRRNQGKITELDGKVKSIVGGENIDDKTYTTTAWGKIPIGLKKDNVILSIRTADGDYGKSVFLNRNNKGNITINQDNLPYTCDDDADTFQIDSETNITFKVNKGEVVGELSGIKKDVANNRYDIEKLKESVIVESESIVESISIKEGILTKTGLNHDAPRFHRIYNVTDGVKCSISSANTGLSNGQYSSWLSFGFYPSQEDAENGTNVISYLTDKETGNNKLEEYQAVVPEGGKFLSVMVQNESVTASVVLVKSAYHKLSEYATKEYVDSHTAKSNSKVLWLGTSIPEGSPYPQDACKALGAKCYNVAIGSSGIIRKTGVLGNDRDGKDLAESAEEKAVRYQDHIGTGPGTITQARFDAMMDWGYDKRILPYINGTIDSCDVVVFDHGYNDREDIYSQLSSMDSANYDTDRADEEFDRSTYIGAFCFLVKKIWEVNPDVRIFICSYLENVSGLWPNGNHYGIYIERMLKNLSQRFDFPYLNMAELNGFNYARIPNSENYISEFNAQYGTNYTLQRYYEYGGNNITKFQKYCMDGVHPHTDKTGNATKIITQSIIKCLTGLL